MASSAPLPPDADRDALAPGAPGAPGAPCWMDYAFLARAARGAGAGLEGAVVSTEIESVGGKGDSYASTMLRVLVHLDTGKDISMIVKYPPPEGSTGACDVKAAFPLEGFIYTKVLPCMMDLLKKSSRVDDLIGPKLYLYQDDPEPVLVMEDLVTSGYTVPDRLQGLSWDEMLLALRKMAFFHATSKILHDEKPYFFDGFKLIISRENFVMMEKFFGMGLVRFINDVESWNDELSRKVVPKLQALADSRCNYTERIVSLAEVSNESFVFIHGDLWTNNMLFKHDATGKPQDVRIIDYQMAGWCSRSIDLYSLFTMAASAEVRKDVGHRRLLAVYHGELESFLKDLGLHDHCIPTLQDIEAEHDRNAILDVAFITAGVPVTTAPAHLGLDFMNTMFDEYDGPPPHPRDRALAEPAFRVMARDALRQWEESGLLDRLVQQELCS